MMSETPERLWFRLWEVRALTGLTDRQIGYCIRTGLVAPGKRGGDYIYEWAELFELYAIARLREAGESLQKVRDYFPELRGWLRTFPPSELRTRLMVVKLAPVSIADVFLVEGESYVRAMKPWGKAFVFVRFNALAAAITFADSRESAGITIKDVVVA